MIPLHAEPYKRNKAGCQYTLDGMAGRGCEAVQNTFEAGLISSKPLLRTLLIVASVVMGARINPQISYTQKKTIDDQVAKPLLRGRWMGRAYHLHRD